MGRKRKNLLVPCSAIYIRRLERESEGPRPIQVAKRNTLEIYRALQKVSIIITGGMCGKSTAIVAFIAFKKSSYHQLEVYCGLHGHASHYTIEYMYGVWSRPKLVQAPAPHCLCLPSNMQDIQLGIP